MEDFLLMDELLSDEERMIRDTTRRFVDEQVTPLMATAYEQGFFPHELMAEIARLGLLGVTLPTEWGGSGSNYVSYGLVCQELERGDSALRSFASVQSSLVMYPIFRYGTQEQKKRFLPTLSAGQMIGCFGLTEPDSGSDPAGMRCQAKKVAGGWRLMGSKTWITNAPIADIALVWAKTEEGIRGFIVEKEFKGFTRHEIKQKLSLRASATGELVFEDCFVPAENYLPGTESGLGAALACLTQARYGIAWGAIGAAMACYEIACNYAQQRQQFGKPLASFQLIQKDLVDMFAEIVKAQWLNLRLGRLQETNKATFAMVSLAKMNACREALTIARLARNILGGNGISLEYHVMRHMNNLEAVFTYEGTDNVHHLIVGKHLTGQNAFS